MSEEMGRWLFEGLSCDIDTGMRGKSILAEKTCRNKTGVINDPLGQPTVPAGSDCRLILKFWDGRILCVKIVITTGRDCGSKYKINMKLCKIYKRKLI